MSERTWLGPPGSGRPRAAKACAQLSLSQQEASSFPSWRAGSGGNVCFLFTFTHAESKGDGKRSGRP